MSKGILACNRKYSKNAYGTGRWRSLLSLLCCVITLLLQHAHTSVASVILLCLWLSSLCAYVWLCAALWRSAAVREARGEL